MRTTWHVNDILRTINEGFHVNEALPMQINDRILFFILSRMYRYIYIYIYVCVCVCVCNMNEFP